MKLFECTYGVLVESNDGERVGMIKGITTRYPNASTEDRQGKERAIPLVEWSCGSTHGVHASNIKKL